MKYSVYVPVVASLEYIVEADSPDDAIDAVLCGEVDHHDIHFWEEDKDSNNWEVRAGD